MKLMIKYELMDFNTFQDETRKNKYIGAKIKKRETNKVAWSCKACKVKKLEGLYDYEFTWYCLNRRKDKDNIMFAQKFIFDGLQEAGIIENDGWNQIGDIRHKFVVDKNNPRIEVTATKAKEEK
ncbi:RusA family crossover junction endodeoxyribonuclease [Helcococcus kunzii]|uniref:hypothetical protein n=1 Tax=Helcococcus kunzii TaxID=40091 RepID=UPI0038AD8826